MRSEGQDAHNDWLLQIGTGSCYPVDGITDENTIEIPQSMITNDNLIESIFGNNIDQLSIEELAHRVIVAPTNEQTLEMNRENYRSTFRKFYKLLQCRFCRF